MSTDERARGCSCVKLFINKVDERLEMELDGAIKHVDELLVGVLSFEQIVHLER